MLSQWQMPQRAPSRPCSASGTPAGFCPTTSPSHGVMLSPLPVLCRSRPHSLPEPASGYTNPAYFIFEGVPNKWTPVSGTGEAHDKQVESPAGGQQRRSPLGARVPSPSEEEWWGGPLCFVPGGPSHGRPLSPPGVGRQKRPKSAVLARDVLGLGDCSLTALHMATCLSQLDWASPEHGGDSQKTLLCQTHSALEPPLQLCREVPRCTPDAHQRGRPRQVLLWFPRGSEAQPGSLGSSGRGGDLLMAVGPPADVGSHPHGSALPGRATTVQAVGCSGRRRSSNVPGSCGVRR